MHTNIWRLSRFIALACIPLCIATGCGSAPRADYHKLDLVEISGTVTLDGEPLAGALVTFEEPDQTFSYGRTDAAGRYQLMLNSEKSGVLRGEKLVRIRTATAATEGEEDEEDPDAKPVADADRERVPGCYNRHSQLQVMVREDDASFDFDLTSDCGEALPSGTAGATTRRAAP